MASEPVDQDGDVTGVTPEQVWAFQMERHRLTVREPKSRAEEVIGRICGLDARLDGAAEVSLWARIRGLESGTIRQELWPDRSLLKTWAMGGALHYLPASEYPLWNGAIRARDRARQRTVWRELGLDDTPCESIIAAIEDALAEATLTIEEVSASVDQRVSDTSLTQLSLREWRSVLRIAAFEGELCIVPSSNGRMQFTHPTRWLGEIDEVAPETARDDVTLRYLGTYGPATTEQFAQWMGIPETDADQWIQAVGDRVVRVDVDGRSGLLPRDSISVITQTHPQQSVRLLPAFDPYVLGALNEPASAIDPEHLSQVRGSNGWIAPTLVVEGEIVGTWEYEPTTDDIEVTVCPFESLPSWIRKEAWVEAVRLSEYFDADLVFNWRPR